MPPEPWERELDEYLMRQSPTNPYAPEPPEPPPPDPDEERLEPNPDIPF